MSTEVTIIIPTHNRHRQLERLLDYYSNIKIPIIVGDSTITPFPNIKKYKNIKYYHYPNYSYSHKLPLIYKKVKTKYVVFCADDDFIIPSAIERCTKFLENNPNYNSAHGHYIFFEEKGRQTTAYPFYLYSLDIDINSPLPSQRLKQLLSDYMQLLYAVTKTDDVKQVFEYLDKYHNIQNDNLVELLQAVILCINGKSKILPILYCAREVTPHSARTYVAPLEIIVTKPQYKKEYDAWLKVVIGHLMEKERTLSKSETQKVVAEAINSYLKGLLFTLPVINIHLYPLRLQAFLIKATFGWAKKLRDLLIKPKNYKLLPKHAYMSLQGKREFETIQYYIEKYRK